MEVFVPEYDWNCQWESVEASVSAGQECGDFCEGDEFKMVRITVGACTTYRIVDGKAVPVASPSRKRFNPRKAEIES